MYGLSLGVGDSGLAAEEKHNMCWAAGTVIAVVSGGPSPGPDLVAANGIADVSKVKPDTGDVTGPAAVTVSSGLVAGVRPVGFPVNKPGCCWATAAVVTSPSTVVAG